MNGERIEASSNFLSQMDAPITVYLSGKMRGIPDYNYPEFHRVCGILRKLTKWRILNPAEMDADFDMSFMQQRPDWHVTDEEAVNFLARDIKIILNENAQAMVFIGTDSWKTSTGARQELFVIQHILRRPVAEFFEDNYGRPFLRTGKVWSRYTVGNGEGEDTKLKMPESDNDVHNIPLGKII